MLHEPNKVKDIPVVLSTSVWLKKTTMFTPLLTNNKNVQPQLIINKKKDGDLQEVGVN
jgi:hypothetical protein